MGINGTDAITIADNQLLTINSAIYYILATKGTIRKASG
jgi:hypothetical protein